MSTYILQKDLPNLKAGSEFMPIADCYANISSAEQIHFHKDYVENNSTWFLPKEERIAISDFKCAGTWPDCTICDYKFTASKSIDNQKYAAIIKAIEIIVNRDDEGFTGLLPKFKSFDDFNLEQDMKVMQAKYKWTDDDMRKCFERKRTQICTVETKDGITTSTTSTQSFEDYLKEINSLK